MRIIRYFVLSVIALLLITVAIANRGVLTIRLLPEELAGLFGYSWEITLPAFVILLAAVLVGVLLGYVFEYVREHKFRVEAANDKRERMKLEQQIKKVAPKEEKGDDVLALLEAS